MTTSKRHFGLVRPCPKCPFRTDVGPYLLPGRVREIATSVQEGGLFYCHETTVPDPEDESAMTSDENSMVCAGSMILMEKAGAPNQMMRVAGRLGMYDPSRLDMEGPVPSSWVEWQRAFVDEDIEEGEPCSVAGPDCQAPAGWMVGGAAVANHEAYADLWCPRCGNPVCSACTETLGDETVCLVCAELDDPETTDDDSP